MFKSIDFFKGINDERTNELITGLQTNKEFNPTDEEIEIVKNNSSNIFKEITMDDVDAFEDKSERNRRVMHWVAGINTSAFLEIDE